MAKLFIVLCSDLSVLAVTLSIIRCIALLNVLFRTQPSIPGSWMCIREEEAEVTVQQEELVAPCALVYKVMHLLKKILYRLS
jgi:hypothetical protein